MRVAREAAIQSNLGESRWRISKSAPSVFEAKPLQILMRGRSRRYPEHPEEVLPTVAANGRKRLQVQIKLEICMHAVEDALQDSSRQRADARWFWRSFRACEEEKAGSERLNQRICVEPAIASPSLGFCEQKEKEGVQPLVFDAVPFMERSGRPGIELLLEMGGKGGVKSAGNDVRAGSCPHRRQNAGRAERNCAWVFGIRGELAAEIRALPQSRLLVPQNDEVMTNVLLGPFTRLGRAALKRGALPTEVQARRLAEGGALENGIDLPAPASPGRVNIPLLHDGTLILVPTLLCSSQPPRPPEHI
jgi:hypothetical protein